MMKNICAVLTVLLAACSSSNAVAPQQAVLPAAASPQTSATFKVIYGFQGGTDGAKPLSRLTIDNAGALYGTTATGGSTAVCYPENDIGCGTVYKLTPSGSAYSENVIYRFGGYKHGFDGAYPAAGVVADSSGNLYGTTEWGNEVGYGIIFKLAPTPSGYTESILHNFSDSPDGQHPTADMVLVNDNTLYGITPYGGAKYGCVEFCAGCGTIFQAKTSGFSETQYSFCANAGSPNGSEPHAGLLYYNNTFYGTAPGGGSTGGGTIFRYSGSVSVLQNFCIAKHCKDGKQPESSLVADGKGALYGTTEVGGRGYGTVFKLTPNHGGYKQHVLYRFRDGTDGANPIGGLVVDKAGSLYGTTSTGGDSGCHCGVIFKLTRSQSGYRESVLHSFTGAADGAMPQASLVSDSQGHSYGTASAGGSGGVGTVFELTP